MLTRWEDKYTSARLGVLASQLVNIALKLHSEENKYISCNFSSRPPRPSPSSTRLRLVELGLGLGGLEWSQRWSISCNFSQVHLGQVEVQLGAASLDFNLASMDLIGVCGGSPRATPLKFNFGQVEVQLGFASLNFNLTKIELETKSVKYNTNYRWT